MNETEHLLISAYLSAFIAIVGIDFSLVATYFRLCCLILARIALSRLSLPHSGCYYFILTCYCLILGVIMAFIAPSLWSFLVDLRSSWESMTSMPLFDRSIWFSITALQVGLWYSHYRHWSWKTIFITDFYIRRWYSLLAYIVEFDFLIGLSYGRKMLDNYYDIA